MTQEPRSCTCGTRLDSAAKKSRGRPATLCTACKQGNKANRERANTARKNAMACALHAHMTKKFHRRFSCKGTIECQSFMSALFDEICYSSRSIPVVFRRALTNKVKPSGESAHMLSTFFGAFCREKRGLWMFLIFKKNVTDEERRKWRALEKAAREKDGDINRYIPHEGSCVQWLMDGFEFGNESIIDDEDTGFAGSEDFEIEPANAEIISFPSLKPVKDIVYEYIVEKENRGLTGRVTLIPAMTKLRGLDRNDVEQALLELQADGLITLDQFNQYRTIKRAA